MTSIILKFNLERKSNNEKKTLFNYLRYSDYGNAYAHDNVLRRWQ